MAVWGTGLRLCGQARGAQGMGLWAQRCGFEDRSGAIRRKTGIEGTGIWPGEKCGVHGGRGGAVSM